MQNQNNQINALFNVKIIHNLLFLIISSLLASCTKDLDENPKNIVVENFYNTPEEVEAAVNAIYPPIRLGATGIAPYNATLECHTDYAYGRGSWAQFNDFAGLDAVNTNRVADFWETFYLAIRNANLVIANAPNGDAISEEDINRYVGEARFMRAWCYFHLVRNWGGVPLRVETNIEQRDVPRSTAEEVYALIDSDLRVAETYLPESTAQPGRPTKWMAKTVLSDVLLTIGQYDEARQKADEVIQSGVFDLVPVTSTDDYQQIFGPNVGVTPEEIFHFKYNRQGQGNYYPWIINHPSTGYHGAGGAYAQYSETTNPFYKAWDDRDLRKGLWYTLDFGQGPNTLLQKKFIDPDAADTYGAINDFPLYRYPDVLFLFAEADAHVNGVTAEGVEAVNQVKRRSYGLDSHTPSAIDYQASTLTTESFLDTILQERAYEFQFEGKRWFDLKRSGKAAAIILANKGKTIAEKHYLWPIPLSELNFNQAMDATTDQNPGY